MRASEIILLLGYSLGMVAGQLLFKQAAMTLRTTNGPRDLALSAMTNFWLLAAVALYATLTVVWVFILSRTDLSKAYAFSALTIVLMPLMAVRLFGEQLNGTFYVGLFGIVGGILVIAWGSEPR